MPVPAGRRRSIRGRFPKAFLISFELVMGSRKRLFVHQVDFILLFRPPCLENRTFRLPAFVRMTDYEVNVENSMVGVSTRHRACRRKPLRVSCSSPVSALSFPQRTGRIAMRPYGQALKPGYLPDTCKNSYLPRTALSDSLFIVTTTLRLSPSSQCLK